jgi:hypothetical protein
MAAEYETSERVEEVAEPLILLHHQDIAHAKIAYMMKLAPEDSDGPPPPARMGKHPAMAKAKLVNPVYHALTGFDFIIEVDEVYWDVLTLEQQVALVDHELCHLAVDEKGFYLKDHDFEEFISIIERHGCWHNPLPELRRAMQEKFDFEDLKSAPQPAAVQ